MQPDALNLAIAQSIELKPTFPLKGEWWISDRKCWTSRTYSEVRDDAVPRDFINDPSLSFLLLKRLAEEGYEPMLAYEKGWQACGWGSIAFVETIRHAETRTRHRRVLRPS